MSQTKSVKSVADLSAPFFHPISLVAVVLLVLNDHIWKYQFSSWLTGKLSDFVGLGFFPLFMLALIEFSSGSRLWRYRKGLLIGAILITDLIFVALKLDAGVRNTLQTLFKNWGFQIQIVGDPLDLMALVMNFPTWIHARHVWKQSEQRVDRGKISVRVEA